MTVEKLEFKAEVKQLLEKNNLLNASSKKGKLTFFATDRPHSFSRLAQQFLGRRSIQAKRLTFDSI